MQEAIENSEAQRNSRRKNFSRITSIIGIILCILILPFLIVNVTLLVSSEINPDVPPSIIGYTPLLVESGSMSPYFSVNDLIIIHNGSENEVYDKGDVICFKSGDSYVTHRIVDKKINENGELVYTTQGDANNTPDAQPVNSSQILGSCATSIKGLGGVLMFIQTPVGMIYCVILPVIILFLLFYIPPKIAARRKKKAVNFVDIASNSSSSTEASF